MSIFAIEKLLWQATANPVDAGRFRAEPTDYLAGFRIDEDERTQLMNWDVASLADRGVNPMLLLMAFSAVTGSLDMMDYVSRINRPR